VLGIGSERGATGLALGPQHAKAFRSHVLEWDEPMDEAGVAAAIDALEGEVLRAKGLVRLASDPDAVTIFQRVGRRSAWTRGEAAGPEAGRSQVVVITAG
jgi:G3E family GTPase